MPELLRMNSILFENDNEISQALFYVELCVLGDNQETIARIEWPVVLVCLDHIKDIPVKAASIACTETCLSTQGHLSG